MTETSCPPAPRLAKLLALGALVAVGGPIVADDNAWRWSGVDRVVAFADVHGAYEELVALLQKTGVIGGQLKWIAGTTHLVSTGDLVDRGAGSREVMDLLMRLQDEARDAGGYVHVLLGNHEIMNLTGDRRYVSEQEYLAFADEEPPGVRAQALREFLINANTDQTLAEVEFNRRHPPGFFGRNAAFSPDGSYGRWLLQRPLLIVINRTVFTHGGLPPAVAAQGIEHTNRVLADELERFVRLWHRLQKMDLAEADIDAGDSARLIEEQLALGQTQRDPQEPAAPASELTLEFVRLSKSDIFDADGPLWYRGSALCHPLLETDVTAAALDRLDADRVVVGHTPTANHRVNRRMDDRVIVMDTGMLHDYYEGVPAAIIIADGKIDIVYGADVPAEPTDEEREQILHDAVIVDYDPDNGRVRLGHDNREYLAVFIPALTNPGYKNEIAAYRLDRLLDLKLAPVAVERKIGGRRGVLSLRRSDYFNETERTERNTAIPSWCASGNEFDLMYAFDALVHNEGRTRESMLYAGPNLSLRIVGFGRAFSTRKGLPAYLENAELGIGAEYARRLAGLDNRTLSDELKGLLGKGQIRALLKRRDEILETWPRL